MPYKENLQEVICPDCGAIFVPSQHLRSFDEKSMKEILQRVGFRIELCKLLPKITSSGNFLKDTVKKMLSVINKKIICFMYGSIFITVAKK